MWKVNEFLKTSMCTLAEIACIAQRGSLPQGIRKAAAGSQRTSRALHRGSQENSNPRELLHSKPTQGGAGVVIRRHNFRNLGESPCETSGSGALCSGKTSRPSGSSTYGLPQGFWELPPRSDFRALQTSSQFRPDYAERSAALDNSLPVQGNPPFHEP